VVVLTTPDAGAPEGSHLDPGAVGALALLSAGAGFLHAAVIHAHEGHGVAPQVFGALAVVQILWAAVALARPTRRVVQLGVAINLAIVAGYVLSRTVGIGFINGFQEVEDIGRTDGITTALEVLVVLGGAVLAYRPVQRRVWSSGRLSPVLLGAVGLAVALAAVPAGEGAATHQHNEAGHLAATQDALAVGQTASASSDGAAEHNHAFAGGTAATATPAQKAAAAKLLADTRAGLWQWTDPQKVHDAGFRSIGDSGTGTEHLVNWRWLNDDHVLDPDHPESLVFDVKPDGTRVLAAAMYIATPGTPDDQIPDIGGPLTQWHIHNNLCYSDEQIVDGAPQYRVVGLTDASGNCSYGKKLGPPSPMLHVWVRDNECGPFASLEGVGAGQAVKEASDPNQLATCDHSTHS
jgi:hypothetical protein